MVGKKQITIDARNFVQGLATSDYVPDGGLGTSSFNLNPFLKPGVIRPTLSNTPGGDGVSLDDLIASCEDPRIGTASTLDRVLVDSDGNIYSYVGGDFDLAAQPASATGYSRNKTDMSAFNGAAFITKTTNIVRATVSGTTWTLDETWWTGTEGQAALSSDNKHPTLTFENFNWFADGNALHNVDAAGVSSADVLLIDENERIECLGIDPGSGLMMLGVTTVLDSNNEQTSLNYIMLYDGYSAYVRRKIPIQGKPMSFTNVGGQVFVTVDNTVNIWNGSGVTFLRRFGQIRADSSLTSLYRSKVTAFQNTFVVAVDEDLFAYGDVANGKKAWFPIYRSLNEERIDFVCFASNETGAVLLTNTEDTINQVVELFSTSTNSTSPATLYAPWYNFERPIFVHRMRIFTSGITTVGGAGIGSIGMIDEFGATRAPAISTFIVLAAETPKKVFDFDFGGAKMQAMQPFVGLTVQMPDIIRIVIYYDVAE